MNLYLFLRTLPHIGHSCGTCFQRSRFFRGSRCAQESGPNAIGSEFVTHTTTPALCTHNLQTRFYRVSVVHRHQSTKTTNSQLTPTCVDTEFRATFDQRRAEIDDHIFNTKTRVMRNCAHRSSRAMQNGFLRSERRLREATHNAKRDLLLCFHVVRTTVVAHRVIVWQRCAGRQSTMQRNVGLLLFWENECRRSQGICMEAVCRLAKHNATKRWSSSFLGERMSSLIG